MLIEINTIEDVRLFAYQLVNVENLSFHPDNDFADYVNTSTGLAVYSNEDVVRLNKLMDSCFNICEQNGTDIYDLMGEPLFRKLKIGIYTEIDN